MENNGLKVKVVCAGNCPVCGNKCEEGYIFICKKCLEKELKYRKKREEKCDD